MTSFHTVFFEATCTTVVPRQPHRKRAVPDSTSVVNLDCSKQQGLKRWHLGPLRALAKFL